MDLLFVNHSQVNCGVHQYGENLYEKLAPAPGWNVVYREVESEVDFLAQLRSDDCDVVFINYHPSTVPWVTRRLIQDLSVPVIGLMHEFDYWSAFSVGADIFDFRAIPDPSIVSRVPNVTVHPRAIPNHRPTTVARSTFTVGSFGFGTLGKGFERIVKAVQKEFDHADIRFHIPYAHFGDSQGVWARQIASNCRALIEKTGIKLEVTHDFMGVEQLIDFLAENSVNLFLYDDQKGRGISSVIDMAAASNRPFGVSDSTMFRHLKSCLPDSFLPEGSIQSIHALGSTQSQTLRKLWSDDAVVASYKEAAQSAVDGFARLKARSLGFNTVLDDHERGRYEGNIQEMWRLCPETMTRKVERANVQQAFVKATVEKFAAKMTRPSILCVGSFEDTASETLIKKGYRIEELDPALNCDLDSFFEGVSTLKGGYDIIFSTSVIEHVLNDEMFISQIRDLLAPDGVAVLTMDYKDSYHPGDPKPGVDVRLYTNQDLLQRFLNCLHGCKLVDHHYWQRFAPDFLYEGVNYSFATYVFRKIQMTDQNRRFSQALETERMRQSSLRQLQALNSAIAERDAQIRGMMESRSWKITAPLRKIAELKKRLLGRETGRKKRATKSTG